MKCVICGNEYMDGEEDPFPAILHKLDGTVLHGGMHPDCYLRNDIGIHTLDTGDCNDCFEEGLPNGPGRYIYELHPEDHFSEIMPSGCPYHGQPEDALAFMLWWDRYKALHSNTPSPR